MLLPASRGLFYFRVAMTKHDHIIDLIAVLNAWALKISCGVSVISASWAWIGDNGRELGVVMAFLSCCAAWFSAYINYRYRVQGASREKC